MRKHAPNAIMGSNQLMDFALIAIRQVVQIVQMEKCAVSANLVTI